MIHKQQVKMSEKAQSDLTFSHTVKEGFDAFISEILSIFRRFAEHEISEFVYFSKLLFHKAFNFQFILETFVFHILFSTT